MEADLRLHGLKFNVRTAFFLKLSIFAIEELKNLQAIQGRYSKLDSSASKSEGNLVVKLAIEDTNIILEPLYLEKCLVTNLELSIHMEQEPEPKVLTEDKALSNLTIDLKHLRPYLCLKEDLR